MSRIPVGNVVPKPFASLIARELLGRQVLPGTCHICGDRVEFFKDQLSLVEYGISGMCQECQDKTFNMTEDDEP